MGMSVFYQRDADPEALRGRTIAVIGYGNQGRAHALNLRDSGYTVTVAQRPGGPNHALAIDDGFDPVSAAEAAGHAELLILALPDEIMGNVYRDEIAPRLRPPPPDGGGSVQTLGFVHGFNVRFGLIAPPEHVDVVMVAPKGPGTLVRRAFVDGGGLTCIIAVHQPAAPATSSGEGAAPTTDVDPADRYARARRIALAWGAGIGGGRGGMIETTFARECEADLFGEQAVLCGGVIELMKAAYETLVDAGFPEELAYFECVHEVKQIVDLQYAAGLAGMRARISNTAAYGGLRQGPRLVTDATHQAMRKILAEIRSGAFADEWMADCRAGRRRLSVLMAAEAGHPMEDAGRRVRNLARAAMPS